MCFSAPASFISSAVIATIGTAIIYRLPNKRFWAVALIPFFFAAQQFIEGFVWLSLPHTGVAKNLYLFFAYSFWPVWIPFSLWVAETRVKEKQLLMLFMGIGIPI